MMREPHIRTYSYVVWRYRQRRQRNATRTPLSHRHYSTTTRILQSPIAARPFGGSQSNHDLLVSNLLSLRGTMLVRRRSLVSGTGKTYFQPSHPADVTGGVTSLRYFNNRHPADKICRIQQQRRFHCVSRKANNSLHRLGQIE